jgi:C1A family cysteine protease
MKHITKPTKMKKRINSSSFSFFAVSLIFPVAILLLISFWICKVGEAVATSQIVISNEQKKPELGSFSTEFERYRYLKKGGKLPRFTSLKHSLGFIPSPFRISHSLKTKSGAEEKTNPLLAGFPSSYDLRSLGKVSSVKNQGSCGDCWAFATMGSLESHWLVLGGSESDLSENNLKECHRFAVNSCSGGNEQFATSYFSANQGPISETDDPYQASNLSCSTGLFPVAYVTDAYFLPKDSGVIKQYLIDYGALYTTLYISEDPAYYNSENHTYYYNGDGETDPDVAAHAVTLAGWDDAKVTAGGTGAWIVKNSWGTSWGDNGYFYVSYNDTGINTDVAAWPSKIDYTNAKTIYMYDEVGATNSWGFSNGTDYGLTKFVATGNQQITKIGTWIRTDGASVSFELYDDFNGTTLSSPLGSLSNQTVDYAGYRTFDLASPISISSGNDFYIKAAYTTPGYNFPIPIEQEVESYAYPSIETGKNWISDDGNNGSWLALGEGTTPYYPYDLDIRAYALSTESVITPAASPAGGSYTAFQSVTLSTATSGASIYYTTNGSIPTTSSTLYTGAIAISTSTTLKAIAMKSGMADSAVISEVYVINLTQVSTPSASPAGGSYNSSQLVTLSTLTVGATIHYTKDGSTPTAFSPAYSSALSISADTTLKAITIKSEMADSAVMSESYDIQVNTDTPALAYSASKKAKKFINLTYKDLALSKKKWVKVRLNGRKATIQNVRRSGKDSIVRIYLKYKKWTIGDYTLVMTYKNRIKTPYINKRGKTRYRKSWERGTFVSENILSII